MAEFQILILLIVITVVVLNIILFFKVWGMTNNIKLKILLIIIPLSLVTIAILMQQPIPQPAKYHNFIDNQTILAIPNFLNVFSNCLFIVVGCIGLHSLLISNRLVVLTSFTSAYNLMFVSLILVGFGSGYYHLSPNNQTLVWDRLPMTLAFMSLTCIIIAEHISLSIAKRLFYPLLLLGTSSVLYWHYSELNSAGDLRFYILVQFLPLIATPLILLLFKGKFQPTHGYWWLFLAYLLAKLCEHFDVQIYQALSIISGHSLKHIIAALGIWALINSYEKRNIISNSSN